jgi:peptidoglycan/xylan/chitin deacetylase (PgdA/CDA1 family)
MQMSFFPLTKIKFKVITLLVVFIGLTLMQSRVVGVSNQNLPVPIDQVQTDNKIIALTINVDWGESYIPEILDILDRYQAKATFFVTGKWAAKHPELIQQIAAKGHLLGNHSYSHPHPDNLTVVQNKEELSKTENIIKEVTGCKTIYYAPPYGEKGKNGLQAADELGYTTILWTLDTIDWKLESTPELITQRILDPKIRYGVKPEKKGAIVLMHPKKNTVKALPDILAGLKNEGFSFVTIEKLITTGLTGNTTP